MAAFVPSRLIRRLPRPSRFLHRCLPSFSLHHDSSNSSKCVSERRPPPPGDERIDFSTFRANCRVFCSRAADSGNLQAPAAIDYSSLLQEDEFHKLADATIHALQEKLEEYGDGCQIDGFDVDYGNEVLTLKLGSLGTYVINKQTPNRQIWLSSPVSGPSRFDWDQGSHAWIYRRTKANLSSLLENELAELCGEPISLS
ncbi:Frataxin [Nymphaea thermarum]|nr:Frataxin [Nymphaea thermarum]